MLRPFALLVVLAPLAAACSSSSPTASTAGTGSSALAPYSAYCTGTLIVDKQLLVGAGAAGEWMSDGSKANAGATILVAYEFGAWHGYAILDDGTPAQVSDDFSKGLGKGTEFNTDCAVSAPISHDVALGSATLYPNKDLSGTACVLRAGTSLTSFNFVGGDVATVSAAEIKATCGLDTAYTKDIHYASLVAK